MLPASVTRCEVCKARKQKCIWGHLAIARGRGKKEKKEKGSKVAKAKVAPKRVVEVVVDTKAPAQKRKRVVDSEAEEEIVAQDVQEVANVVVPRQVVEGDAQKEVSAQKVGKVGEMWGSMGSDAVPQEFVTGGAASTIDRAERADDTEKGEESRWEVRMVPARMAPFRLDESEEAVKLRKRRRLEMAIADRAGETNDERITTLVQKLAKLKDEREFLNYGIQTLEFQIERLLEGEDMMED